MPSVKFSAAAAAAVDSYSETYRAHFENAFSDTGIWSERQIVERYSAEATTRGDEIFDAVAQRLTVGRVIGRTPDKCVVIPWRSRYIFASWEDGRGFRIVTDLEIR